MRQAFGQVYAVGPYLGRQRRIGADQKQQAASAGDINQTVGLRLGARRPKAAIDDGRSSGQAPGRAFDIGGAFGIGEEQQRRQRGLSPRRLSP